MRAAPRAWGVCLPWAVFTIGMFEFEYPTGTGAISSIIGYP
jgi:hypothetical protein